MKLSYIGTRKNGNCEILVKDRDTGNCWSLPPRLDLFNHSPTGFEWGYSGSGPAQAALAILTSHLLKKENWPPVMAALQMMQEPEKCMGVETHEYLAVCYHQIFKSRVVANLPHDEWELTEEQINEIIS
jgi:hypothetical protein